MAKPGTEPAARARRARTLVTAFPQAAQPLDFYARLVDLQGAVVAAHPHVLRLPASFQDALDPEAAADAVPSLLQGLVLIAPPPVASAATAMLQEGHADWRHLVHTCWSGGREEPQLRLFIAEALLQPFAERAASESAAAGGRDSGPGARDSGGHGDSGSGARDSKTDVGADFRWPELPNDGACRICGDRPVVAVLREEAHGARRSLVCGFCLTERPAPRIACLHCGETQFDKLNVYRAEAFPGVRVDACDTCRTYLKTVDLTLDATAIPVVDDIASVALDLWAREQGYQRLRPNLLRL
jgi:hypothetical protein